MSLNLGKPQPHPSKQAFKASGITVRALAVVFGTSPTTVWSWLNGYSKPNPDVDRALTELALHSIRDN